MKSSQILVIVFCLSLVLVVDRCTDSKTAPSEKTSAHAIEQPTTTTQAPIEQTNSAQNTFILVWLSQCEIKYKV